MSPESTLLIGIDAGATKTLVHARTLSNDRMVVQRGPAANFKRHGLQHTVDTFWLLVREVEASLSVVSQVVLCAGVAGAATTEEQRKIEMELVKIAETEQKKMSAVVVSDARIALEGAFRGQSGVIAIAGTGSMVLAKSETGQLIRAGGLGYLLGDEGGGLLLGLHGLKAVAAAYDGGPSTMLLEMLSERFGIISLRSLINLVYVDEWPPQQFAPSVLEAAEQGDAEALRIVREQSTILANQVARVVTRSQEVTPHLAFVGGLTNNAFYKTTLMNKTHSLLPKLVFCEPLLEPVEGAMLLAESRSETNQVG